MSPLLPKTWVEVSRAALRHNALQIRQALGPKMVLMAVVKSNAYGHGIAQTVRAVRGQASWFGVDALQEALEVLKVAPRSKILVLGMTLPTWMSTAVRRGVRISVSSPEAARTVPRGAIIHLEVETGLTRQGVGERDLPTTLRLLKKRGARVEGMFTHYANIEDTTDHAYARGQLTRFLRSLQIAERVLGAPVKFPHTACSAAALLFPETHFALARVGISLYGHWPSKETLVSARGAKRVLALRPALTWKTTVAQVKSVKAGTPISYGLTERMRRAGKIAVLPVGYWDGYDRGLSSVGEVLVRGRRAKIMGRICMNMCMVDVSGIPGVRAGDEVVLLGQQALRPGSGQGRGEITAEELAGKISTINYEVLTRINPTLPRILV
ncbi:MAG: alanine racemase [Patescibacteria group bacterium]